jgi:DNA repair proteins
MAENKRHKGHRQRMRERVQSYGLDSLAEHEALEYVLYLTNAQKDTNGIVHDLIDRFGDFAAVLEASEEELCTVEGVGPSTARMLHLLPQISRYYGRSRISTTRCIKTTEQMGSYLMAKFAWSDYERAMLVSLDSRKRVRAAVWLREGTSDRVSLDIKNVVAAAIKGGTDAVVLCHNHPNGVALPSLEDMDATGSIARALGLVNVHLLDHFILTDTEYFSMRDANRLPIYDFKTGTLFWP